jgi:protein MpaA
MKQTPKTTVLCGLFSIILLCVLVCGCTPKAVVMAPTPDPVVRDVYGGLDTILPPVQVRVGGRSLQNRIILYDVLGHGPDTTLIISTIHGNEDAGTPLVRRLSQHLQANSSLLLGRTVVIIPVLNPDGRAARVRYNAHGVDLNRNFASENRVNDRVNGMKALSEPETEVLVNIIREYSPSKIVTLHQPLSCVDYDGPGLGLAQAMADACPLPVKKLGARPGSLGAYTGETLHIPTVTLEMNDSDSYMSEQALWDTYGGALIAAILY